MPPCLCVPTIWMYAHVHARKLAITPSYPCHGRHLPHVPPPHPFLALVVPTNPHMCHISFISFLCVSFLLFYFFRSWGGHFQFYLGGGVGGLCKNGGERQLKATTSPIATAWVAKSWAPWHAARACQRARTWGDMISGTVAWTNYDARLVYCNMFEIEIKKENTHLELLRFKIYWKFMKNANTSHYSWMPTINLLFFNASIPNTPID